VILTSPLGMTTIYIEILMGHTGLEYIRLWALTYLYVDESGIKYYLYRTKE